MVKNIANKLQYNVSLAAMTTIQLGGPAKEFVECEHDEEIFSALRYAADKNISVHVLGGGSNTVFADEGFNGLVIKIANKGVQFETQGEQTLIHAGAGELWDSLVEKCVERGLPGFECLSGIPGTSGAAPVQNIGAYGNDVSSLIFQVITVDRVSLAAKTFTQAECQFGYRDSLFKNQPENRYVITNVIFKPRECTRPDIAYPDIIEQLGGDTAYAALDCGPASLRKIREAVLNIRRQKSMVFTKEDANSKSCGSFFINPIVSEQMLDELKLLTNNNIPFFHANDQIKIPAAWLIEQAGFPKGFRRDGVGISSHHNLSIVNYGGTTRELINLAQDIQKAVKNKFNIDLVLEPNLIPYNL